MASAEVARPVPCRVPSGNCNMKTPQSNGREAEETDPLVSTANKSSPASTVRYFYQPVWRRALFRIKVQRSLKAIKDDLLVFGTTHDLADLNMRYKVNIDQLIGKKARKEEDFRQQTTTYFIAKSDTTCLISPNNVFKQAWNCLVILLLAYTATIMPFRFAFYDVIFWDGWAVWELLLDFLFCCDICINFFSIYVRASGAIVTNRRQIVRRYLKTWFALDLIASIPYTLLDLWVFDQDSTQPRLNSFIRILRLPRMYKLLRLVRVLKSLKGFQGTGESLLERIQEYLQVNSRKRHVGLYKLGQFFTMVLVVAHITACLWYFFARIGDFEPECWVVRADLVDQSQATQYIAAFYWSVTTMVTVGYGDITPKTTIEIIIAIFWMFIGIGFYSYTISSLSTFLMSIDTRESILTAKTEAVRVLAREAGISRDTKSRIMVAIRYNTFQAGNVWDSSVFDDLPKGLKYEVATSMYDGAYKNFPFFTKRDMAFVLFVMPKLRPMTLNHDEYVYHEGEYADSVYFICRGRVNFVLSHSEVAYKTYLRGSYIGETELVKGLPREDNAQAAGRTEMLVLDKGSFWAMMDEFPSDARSIKATAVQRRRNNKLALLTTRELLKLKKRKGTLTELIGKQQIMIPTEELDLEEEDFDTRVENLTNAAQEVKRDLSSAIILLQRNSAALSLLQRRIPYLRKTVRLPPITD